MPKGRVIDRDLGYKRITHRLVGMGNLGVSVGVQPGPWGNDEDLLTKAVVNEFGSENGHVPERSYLRSTLDENQAKYARKLRTVVEQILDGRPEVEALRELGKEVRDDVQRKIRSGVRPENATSTILAKGHDRTLQGKPGDDHTTLHNAIEARVGSLK
jgi:hypothetical protein